jgi:hypothetical protein
MCFLYSIGKCFVLQTLNSSCHVARKSEATVHSCVVTVAILVHLICIFDAWDQNLAIARFWRIA